MNRVFVVRGGVKPACSKYLKVFICRHSELISGYVIKQKIISIIEKMLKRVQHDIKVIINLFTTGYSQFPKKFFAFTLAETLIVIGIIGVVAALTLPNLNQSTGDKEKVAKVKKIYSNLADAFGRAVIVYGPYSQWCRGLGADQCDERTMERIIEFMKVSKNCGNGANCMPANVKALNGSSKNGYGASATDVYKCVLADGTGLAFDEDGQIIVDIDGIKGANTLGKDIFTFTVETGELYPEGYNQDDTQLKNQCFKFGNSCSGWVIQNENMDYLKCPNDLSLTKTTCK